MPLDDTDRRIVREALDEIRATPSPVDRAPLGCALADYPLLWQTFLGGIYYVGEDQDVLGWTYYGELGATLGVDLRRLGLMINALRLGTSIIQGDNITGWSIVVGYTF